jgi:hypothetical protein
MYIEVFNGGQKLWPLFLRLLREILFSRASAGASRRHRREIRAYDKRRNRNTAAKALWGETSKRRIVARQLRPEIDAPTGLVHPNSISGF